VGRVVLLGTRIVIPLMLAHEGHQGIVKTKARLRTKVWFPLMDKMSEELCRACHECQLVSQSSKPEPMKRTELPEGPWQHLAADLLGPLANGDYLFVVIDYYSRFFEVRVVKSVTSAKMINCLEDIFAVYGLPVSIKTDSAPNFTSAEFEQYLCSHVIRHVTSIPLWPQSNGEVERQNKTLLKYMKIVHSQGKNLKTELNKFLLAYRTTPHSTTGIAPAEMLFRRKIRTKLPEMKLDGFETIADFDIDTARQKDAEQKQKGKNYSDDRRGAVFSDIKPGDTVLLQQQQSNKLSLPYNPGLFTVADRHGQEVIVTSQDGTTYRRNVAHVKKYVCDSQPDEQSVSDTDQLVTPEQSSDGPMKTSPAATSQPGGRTDGQVFTRSGRLSRKPSNLADYV